MTERDELLRAVLDTRTELGIDLDDELLAAIVDAEMGADEPDTAKKAIRTAVEAALSRGTMAGETTD